jgi:epoxyqueuosine reductase
MGLRGIRRRPVREAPWTNDELAELGQRVLHIGREEGCAAVGIARAEPFSDVRRTLEDRKASGLSSDMGFTYRNPARSSDPTQALPGAASLVVAARRYRRADVDPPDTTAGRIARYAWTDHYEPLRNALTVMGNELRRNGFRTRVMADDNTLVDRAAAYRAGIGWFGKNANLLLPGQGSWFVLGSLVTDAVLPPSPAPVADGCGSCVRCIDGCPTEAIVAPGVIDARRCLAWLVQRPGPFPIEFREALGDRIYGCDDCQEVCPPNRTFDRREPPVDAEDDAQPWTELLTLVTDTDAQLLQRHGRFYLPDRDPNVLRRNALLALGNRLAEPFAPQVEGIADHMSAYETRQPPSIIARTNALRVINDALLHENPLVRGAAAWAAGRAGAPELCVARLNEEHDAQVREELAQAIAR